MIVTCPRCSTRYRPYGDDFSDADAMEKADEAWIKVVCPVCEQWIRLNDGKKIPPPDVAPEFLQQAKAQAEIVEDGDEEDEPGKASSRGRGSETVSGRCRECRAKFRAPEKFAGKSVKCPRCKSRVPIPEFSEDNEDWGSGQSWEPGESSRRTRRPTGGVLQNLLDFNAWPTARKFWVLGSGVALTLVIGCVIAYSYGKGSRGNRNNGFIDFERQIQEQAHPPGWAQPPGFGPGQGLPFPAVDPGVQKPKRKASYSPGDRVRAKFMNRVFAAEVVEQLGDRLVELRSLGVELGEPMERLEKGETIAVRVEDILP